jgi:hypothetical protein
VIGIGKMWCETLSDYDVMRELGRKVPIVINHMLKNKYVRYTIRIDTTGFNEYLYFYINDKMQIIEIDPDLGI